jgi:hypothetical protein
MAEDDKQETPKKPTRIKFKVSVDIGEHEQGSPAQFAETGETVADKVAVVMVRYHKDQQKMDVTFAELPQFQFNLEEVAALAEVLTKKAAQSVLGDAKVAAQVLAALKKGMIRTEKLEESLKN